jgi:hypothetical protein
MPLCTYLDDDRVKAFRESVTDADLNELLADANAIGDGGFVIQQQNIETGRLWWKRKYQRFTLYGHTVSTEYQILNMVPASKDYPSYATNGNRGAVGNFLMGYINGYHEGRKESVKSDDEFAHEESDELKTKIKSLNEHIQRLEAKLHDVGSGKLSREIYNLKKQIQDEAALRDRIASATEDRDKALRIANDWKVLYEGSEKSLSAIKQVINEHSTPWEGEC